MAAKKKGQGQKRPISLAAVQHHSSSNNNAKRQKKRSQHNDADERDDIERKYEKNRLAKVVKDQMEEQQLHEFAIPIKTDKGLAPMYRKKLKETMQKKKPKKVNKRGSANEDDDESNENTDENNNNDDDEAGLIIEEPVMLAKDDEDTAENEEEYGDEDIEDEEEENARSTTKAEEEILSDPELRMERLRELQERIASLATHILNDPIKNIKTLSEIHEFLVDPDKQIQKISLLSLLALYKDLIPDYRINIDLIKSESHKQLSKEVKNLRFFESNLLENYQLYLQHMDKTLKSNASRDMKYVCLKCLGDLLNHAQHFNFRSNIMTVLCPFMNKKDEYVSFFFLNCFTNSLLKIAKQLCF